MAYFNVGKIEYEGPQSKNPLAFSIIIRMRR